MKTKLFSLCFVLLASMSGCANDATTGDKGSTNDQKAELLCPAPANVQAVDLGLPSGVKWASCNVGAMNPEDYGNYYAWGEVLPKMDYSWETYKYANYANGDGITKYCSDASYGVKDNKKTLTPNDDAAHVNWGGKWRMPTLAEWEELYNDKYCRMIVTTQNGIEGVLIKSRINGNSIFLPYAGLRKSSHLDYDEASGFYWSSSLYGNKSSSAWHFYFSQDFSDKTYSTRIRGFSIRPVCK